MSPCDAAHGRIRCGACGCCPRCCRCEQRALQLECPKCREVKQLDLFPVDRRRPSGRQTPCRTCQHESVRTWKRRVGYNSLLRGVRRALKASQARSSSLGSPATKPASHDSLSRHVTDWLRNAPSDKDSTPPARNADGV